MKIVARVVVTVMLIAAVFCSCTKEKNVEGDGVINGHTYIDLGLPSGTLWAACNVGARTPEGYGDYYAWGEITKKSTYDYYTYRYCNDHMYKLTKYCHNARHGDNGFVDYLTTLQPNDDAAIVNWSGDWRMPVKTEWEELINNTSQTWTTQNGVYGSLFTATNGASLFLPAAGFRYHSSIYYNDTIGYYWSSSLRIDDSSYAWGIASGSGFCYVSNFARAEGIPVRPVRSVPQN